MVSKSCLLKRAARLYEQWDSAPDPYGLPPHEFTKAVRKCDEASTILLTIAACEAEQAD